METHGIDDFYKLHEFKPTSEEAVTYFLPRLLAGAKHKLIRNADIYACEPKDLARDHPPVPSAVSTGDRFFFTTCKHKNGRFAHVAGAGTWTVQKTENVVDQGVKVGEVRKLSFKKDNVYTGWVMEEYRCLLPQAVVANEEKVLCKIHLAQHVPVAAREESAAYKLRQHRAEPPVPGPNTVTVTASTHAQKRPAPVAAADLLSCKNMRVAAPVAFQEPKEEHKHCPEMHGHDDVYKIHQFKPTKEEAVTYFLPHLLAGKTHKLIRNADVYACEPKELSRHYPPVPRAVKTGDRFFLTTCKRKKGRYARVAGAGTWTAQKTENVYHAGVKVGEVKHLSFKKDNVSTGWVMEEYRCFLPEAVIGEVEKVLCKIHLSQHAPATARQESDAYKLRQERAETTVPGPKPVTMTATGSAHVHKRQAPVAAADLSSCKKMRIAAPVPTPDEVEYEDCPVLFTHAAPVSLPAASMEGPHVQRLPAPVAVPVPAPEEEYEDCPVWSTEVPDALEADDDMGRMSCTVDELLGEQQHEQALTVEAENNIEQLVFNDDIEQLDIDQLEAPIDWESLDLQSLLADNYEEEGELQKGCNYNAAAADLQAPPLQGHSQFAAVNNIRCG
ncbi:hypothetical protein ACQ4PT_009304 [Festuca glaucescens]